MKNMVFILIVFVGSINMLYAEIGWSGQIYPNSGTFQVIGSNISVYYQIWKEGVTSLSGQDEDISAKLYYKLSTESIYNELDMSYLGDQENNDEYSVDIPESYFSNNEIIHFYCEGFDASDNTYSYGTDQNVAGPFDSDNPGIYNIGSLTSQDVTVTFQVNMSLETTVNEVSVAGSFNNWAGGQNMLTVLEQDLIYSGEVLIPAGTNPVQEYKFVNGEIWEDELSNRSFIIDDLSPTQILEVSYYNNHDPAIYLSQDVAVTFNVNVSDSVNAGAIFNSLGINGNVFPLDWDFIDLNHPMYEISSNIWAITLTFQHGSSKYLDFKFAHDGNDWEAEFEENHQATIDDSNSTQIVDCVYGDMGTLSIDGWNILPNSIVILQNYPNPFNPSTKISFSIPSKIPRKVKIAIYNMTGQMVKQYSIFGNQSSITWNAEDQSSGIYFYKLFVNNEIFATQKMILLK